MTTLQTIDQNAAQKEILINQNFVAVAPYAALAQRTPNVAGLRYYYYGGMVPNTDGTITNVVDSYVSITTSASQKTTYIEYNPVSKTVTQNNTAFTEGCYSMATVTSTTQITNVVASICPNFVPYKKNTNKTFLNNLTLSTTITMAMTDVAFTVQNTGTSYIFDTKLICTTANTLNTLNEEISGFALIGANYINIADLAYFDKVNSAFKVIIPSALYIYDKVNATFVSIATLTKYKLLVKVK